MASKPKTKPKRIIPNEFLAFTLEGKGKETGSDAHFWYRGDILYYDNTPSWRVVEGNPQLKKKVLLVKHVGFHRKADDPVLKLMTPCPVPDIGVFSKYPNDWMPEGPMLNDRVRFIMLSQVRHLVYEELPKVSGDQLERREHKSMLKQIERFYSEYDLYNKLVGCGWAPMPSIYREQFDDEVKRRIDAYNDPAKVKQRERSKARKIAMEALGAGDNAA